MNTVQGTTQLLGIMGHPVSHSLSPAMHNAALQVMGLDYIYVPLPIPVADLPTAIAGLKTIDSLQGFNLTIPHKQQIMPLLDEIDPFAAAVGAVNTVKRVGDRWVGRNTDVVGFLTPLRQLNHDWSKIPVLVLGSGGAAKAVIAGCLELGCGVIHVVGRDVKKMKLFHGEMTNNLKDYRLRVHPWSSLEHLLDVAGLVVNATPIGMGHDDDHTPLDSSLIAQLPAHAIVYDLIYVPRPTKLLRLAQARGLFTIDGLPMLLNQGAVALEWWIGQKPPIDVMEQALLDGLAQRP
ncbi:MAG: shikimate dehydrogenase [Pseudanabaenaceae cyanobacterium]